MRYQCKSDRNMAIVPRKVFLQGEPAHIDIAARLRKNPSSLEEKKTCFRRARGKTRSRVMRAFPFLVCERSVFHYISYKQMRNNGKNDSNSRELNGEVSSFT